MTDKMPEKIYVFRGDKYNDMIAHIQKSLDKEVEYTLSSTVAVKLEAAEKMAEAFIEVFRISDRKTDVWDAAKEALKNWQNAQGEIK